MEVAMTKLTKKLEEEMESIVKEGWYANKSEFIRDSIRDMIRKIKAERMEASIKEDVLWGLYGKD